MSPSTQNYILELCARSSSVESIAVFYNANWTSAKSGMAGLSLAVCYMRLMSCNEFSIAVIESLDTFSDHKWILRSTIHTRMYGSSAQHTAWVIDRIRGHRSIRMGMPRLRAS